MTTGYRFGLSPEIVTQWIIMLILAVSGFLLTRNLKTVPDKKQAALEKLYITVESLVKNTMGESYTNFIPYVGSLIIYLLCLNYTGLIGIKPPTQNLSVTAALGVTTFMTIHYTAIKRNGLLGYAKGYAHPFIVMLPINIMERVMLPVSLSLRLFGNILAASFLVELVYESLDKIAWIAQIGLPVPLHAYFDIFDGCIQMVIFVMLTMINIKITVEH